MLFVVAMDVPHQIVETQSDNFRLPDGSPQHGLVQSPTALAAKYHTGHSHPNGLPEISIPTIRLSADKVNKGSRMKDFSNFWRLMSWPAPSAVRINTEARHL
jgi:hypothetical protein